MTKSDAISLVLGKYPRAIAVQDEETGRSSLILDCLNPRSNHYSTNGDTGHTWTTFADYILKGTDF